MLWKRVNFLWLLGLITVPFSWASNGYTEFHIAIYNKPGCAPQDKLSPMISIDTNLKCSNYSYVDSKGKRTYGSQSDMRCYKDKVVFNKYPFSPVCSSAIVETKNHTLVVGKCQQAPSHEGYVYEKIEDYIYPGKNDCQLQDNKK